MLENDTIIKFLQENKLDEAYTHIVEKLNGTTEEPLLYLHLGDLLFKKHDYEHAELAYNRAIQQDSTLATAYFNLGNVFSVTEQYKKARAHFLKSLELGLNKEGSVHFMIGLMYFKESEFERSLPYFLRAYELNTDDLEAYFQYGLSLAKCNYIQNAKEIFEDIIEKKDSHSDAYYNLGLIEIISKNPEKARELFLNAIHRQEDHILAKQALHQLQSV